MKLHLGCGDKYIPGFFHLDILPLPHVDHAGPAENLHFLAENTVDLIYACHVLEHYGRHEIRDVLSEWHRVLKPGGVLRLAVPDFAAVCHMYDSEGLRDGYSGLVGLVCGGQRNCVDFHKAIFDEPFLGCLLKRTGFREVRRWDWRTTEHACVDDYSQAYLPHLDKENGRLMSLNLEGVK
jgi:ubiquinone/menaquinone biosynthesis C-methylase UbiE